jgi:GNAT superfamily N-acetyltransferase
MILNYNDNILDLLVLVKEFIAESELPVTYSQEKTLVTLNNTMQNYSSDVIGIYIGDELAAAAIVATGTEFHEEAFGYLMKIYVRPAFRGTGVSRLLMTEVTQWFDSRNVVSSFCTSTAHIGQSKQFENLMGKYGYVLTGPTLIRSKP